jgi:putative hydrolase of the HAD superfamily
VVGAQYGVDVGELRSVFFEGAWHEVIVGRLAIEETLAKAIDELRWPMTVEDFLRSWFEADYLVDHEVVDAVRRWEGEGARLVLVTNQEHRRARFLEERLATLLPIGGMAYSGAVGVMKKDPAFYPVACERLGIDRDDGTVVFVDDRVENVGAARRHGWAAVHFTKDGDWRSEIDAALAAQNP